MRPTTGRRRKRLALTGLGLVALAVIIAVPWRLVARRPPPPPPTPTTRIATGLRRL